MNPVLLKPETDTGAQVIVQGRPRRDAAGARLHSLAQARPACRRCSTASRTSRATADIVLVEGAGSPAEINLRAGDIANMGFAAAADVPVLLAGDIDRGGVIASLVGTHAVLEPAERARIRGFLVNKFRGDLRLFDDGVAAIERLTGWPCLGVVPWLPEAAWLPAEDAVDLERAGDAKPKSAALKVVVPMLSRIANFDDLDPLGMEPGVRLVFVRPGRAAPRRRRRRHPAGLEVDDRRSRVPAPAGLGHRHQGACAPRRSRARPVRRLPDARPHHRGPARHRGAGRHGRRARPPRRRDRDDGRQVDHRGARAGIARPALPVRGYEIHLGRTEGADCARPVADHRRSPGRRHVADGRVQGTYVHGLFGSDEFRRAWLAAVSRSRRGRLRRDGRAGDRRARRPSRRRISTSTRILAIARSRQSTNASVA